MFLGLIVFLSAGLLAAAVAIKAVKALFRFLLGSNPKGKQDRSDMRQSESGQETPKGKKAEAVRKETRDESVQEPQLDEETLNRYAAAGELGITENVCEADVEALLDPRMIASRCSESGALTQLEFEHRGLAGENYKGFNLLIEKGERIVLTFSGQAVAAMSKVEIPAVATINGVEVTGSALGVRINTFPPTLQDGMTPSDLEKILETRDAVIACGPDAEKTLKTISGVFSTEDNTRRFKAAVDGKIREKMTAALSADGHKKSFPKKIQA